MKCKYTLEFTSQRRKHNDQEETNQEGRFHFRSRHFLVEHFQLVFQSVNFFIVSFALSRTSNGLFFLLGELVGSGLNILFEVLIFIFSIDQVPQSTLFSGIIQMRLPSARPVVNKAIPIIFKHSNGSMSKDCESILNKIYIFKSYRKYLIL